MNPKVDFYFHKESKWHEEMEQLRTIILNCGLAEELKWGNPCYTYEGKNIVILQEFKEYCAVLFFKGALLKDPNGILIQQTKNVQLPRQIRFTDVRSVKTLKAVLKAYIHEVIALEEAGVKPDLKKEPEPIPDELQRKLKQDAALRTAFKALTPGRQRAYLLYFSAPKQSSTRESRIEKYIPQILAGKGMND
jgi:uncharacterized protein YdeI (YjbR/CyaY-like superfamily)